jgi:P-type Ca2+ transporter type 2C
MLNFLYANNVEAHTLLSERQNESEIECVIPFNPYRKSQLTVTRQRKGDSTVRVVLKGAPEIVISKCTHSCSNGFDDTIKLTEDLKKQFLDVIYNVNLGKKGIHEKHSYRCFAYAYKDIDSDQWETMQKEYNNFQKEEDRELIEKDMIFVICFALEDPLRKEVSESIKRLQDANIEVRMISGDHLVTARALAVKAGIIREEDAMVPGVCMTGDDLIKILGYPEKCIVDGKEHWQYNA